MHSYEVHAAYVASVSVLHFTRLNTNDTRSIAPTDVSRIPTAKKKLSPITSPPQLKADMVSAVVNRRHYLLLYKLAKHFSMSLVILSMTNNAVFVTKHDKNHPFGWFLP